MAQNITNFTHSTQIIYLLFISHSDITVIVVTVVMVIQGSELVCYSMDHKQDSGSKWQIHTRYDRFTMENSCSKYDMIP